MMGRLLLSAILLAGLAGELAAQDDWFIRDHYRKSEFRIPMRDGVELFTSVFAPRDTSESYPIILIRTPYSVAPYSPDEYPDRLHPSMACARDGFIFAYQDVRGRYESDGSWVELRPYVPDKGPDQTDESSDAYDTIDWLVKNIPHNNGRVGVTGISYPGFYAAMAAIDAHPAVAAVSPQAPIADDFIGDDEHHNGAFFLAPAFDFYIDFWRDQPKPGAPEVPPFEPETSDGYRFFLDLGPVANAQERYFKGSVQYWTDMMEHGTYDGFYQQLCILPHLKNVRPSILVVGGWFDAEDLYGTLHTFRTIEKNNPQTPCSLVMGPWAHAQWMGVGRSLGSFEFGSKTATYFQENIELPFFRHWLKGKEEPTLPRATVFLTGANEWRTYDSWPPKESKPDALFLADHGGLSPLAPKDESARFDEYMHDPARPVPFTSLVTMGVPAQYMVEDQRFAARRPDVLVYQTPVLDANVIMAGPMEADLFVSTSGTDADWVVKVIDVFPDDTSDAITNLFGVPLAGYQMLVRGEVMRGKFRNSYTNPEPFAPGQLTRVRFTLQDVFHEFRKGHRIMVQIQSSWFPLVDRNPGVFKDIYRAKEEDFRKTTQRVYHSPKHPSAIRFRVLTR